MIRQPPIATGTVTLAPSKTLFLSGNKLLVKLVVVCAVPVARAQPYAFRHLLAQCRQHFSGRAHRHQHLETLLEEASVICLTNKVDQVAAPQRNQHAIGFVLHDAVDERREVFSPASRSEERRVGKEGVSTGRY